MVPGGHTTPMPWRRHPASSLTREGTSSPRRRRQRPGFDRPHPRASAGGGERGGEGGGSGGIRVPPSRHAGVRGGRDPSSETSGGLLDIWLIKFIKFDFDQI
jgi:hypothetical protein